jgi:hypothetical protein
VSKLKLLYLPVIHSNYKLCAKLLLYARSLGARIRSGKVPKIITNVNLEKRRKYNYKSMHNTTNKN